MQCCCVTLTSTWCSTRAGALVPCLRSSIQCVKISKVLVLAPSTKVDYACAHQGSRVAISWLWGCASTSRLSPHVLIDVQDVGVTQKSEATTITTIVMPTKEEDTCGGRLRTRCPNECGCV